MHSFMSRFSAFILVCLAAVFFASDAFSRDIGTYQKQETPVSIPKGVIKHSEKEMPVSIPKGVTKHSKVDKGIKPISPVKTVAKPKDTVQKTCTKSTKMPVVTQQNVDNLKAGVHIVTRERILVEQYTTSSKDRDKYCAIPAGSTIIIQRWYPQGPYFKSWTHPVDTEYDKEYDLCLKQTYFTPKMTTTPETWNNGKKLSLWKKQK